MTTEELVKYWVELSDENYKSMMNMFNAAEYMWSLLWDI